MENQTDNLNALIVFFIALFSVVSFGSGLLWFLKSFFGLRAHLNRSMNADLEVIRVSRVFKKKDGNEAADREKEAWKAEIGAMEQLLTTFANIKEKVSFFRRFLYDNPSIALEIANPCNSEEIFFYISMPKKFKETIEKQVNSYFPNAVVEKMEDYTIFNPNNFTAASVIGLKAGYFFPVRTYEYMEVDPLNELISALSRLHEKKEGAAVQVVLQAAGTDWRLKGKEIAHEMQQGKRLKDLNKSFFRKIFFEVVKFFNKNEEEKEKKTVQLTPEEQEILKAIDRKASKSGFHVNIRLIASAETQSRAEDILSHLENTFIQFENYDSNHFTIKRRGKGSDLIFNYIFRNFADEDSIILGVEEIAGIYHIPISTTENPRIKWLKSNTAPPPTSVPKEGLLLGFNEYRGLKTDIRLTKNDRRRHLYAIGQTGAGKSNFLQEMAKQDAKNGEGFCFIDPHGDAIEDILTAIPEERARDVIIFDPSDSTRPFGLNMLEYDQSDPQQKTFVINEMIGIFEQLYDMKATGGPMFEQYMRNAMLLIMDDPASGSTLLEISKVLADEDFRRYKLRKCKNPIVVDFWVKEAEKAGGEASLANMVPYITSKLTTFISNDMMRPIIAQQESTINMREIMDNKKIFLVKLSKGKIGEINAKLLGMVIVGKILMAALSRVDTAEDERKDFYLYLDEFQNVTTNSISQILSEARKYRLCLVLAHQFIAQLKEDISKAVFGNVGSMLAFRVGPEDADFLEKQFAPVFSANDLSNVDNYNAFARLLINGELSKPFNIKTYPPTHGNQELAGSFKEISRLRYGKDINFVNAEIMKRMKISN